MSVDRFLEEHGLGDLRPTLRESLTLDEMQALCSANRPRFLERLKAPESVP